MHKDETRAPERPEIAEIRREFNCIVGYELLKEELIQICDSMRNREFYEKIGASIPHGLLLSGVPGVGKTTMAEAMARASGRPVYRLRKNAGRKNFIDEIKKTFAEAAEGAPSLLLLDDIDKYADDNDMLGTAPEYAALQTCIDELGDSDVFITATANNPLCLPESLTRSGRFDRKRRIKAPGPDDAAKILRLYLGDSKRLADDVDIDELAMLACGFSCSYIESLANDAGVLAGYERSDEITMDHFIRAYIKWRSMYSERKLTPEERRRIAFYEAGRAVVMDILAPEALTIATAKAMNGVLYTDYLDEIPLRSEPDRPKYQIMRALAGRAAVELEFGKADEYSSKDIRVVYSVLEDIIRDGRCSLEGDGSDDYLELVQIDYVGVTSEEVQRRIEDAIDRAAVSFYEEVLTILKENRGYLNRVAEALTEREYLRASDIRMLRPDKIAS